MSAAKFIAGDWGTSHLRLCLCDPFGNVLDRKIGPGIAAIRGDVSEAFFSLVEPWDKETRPLPVVLCGMVGSSIGWREAPYLPCPIKADMIGRTALLFEVNGREIALAPGLSCTNVLGAPDVMRGEETQILGALQHNPDLREGSHLLCMPGTHTKWVWLKDGAIERFLTAVTGELFEVLLNHSVLVKQATATEITDTDSFRAGLEQTIRFPDAKLVHLLFQIRSRQLTGQIKHEDASAYLSGVIIGSDVSGAVKLFQAELTEATRVILVGTSSLSALYAQALGARGISTTKIDGMTSSFAGLTTLYGILHGKGVGYAA